jgi:hypothetical protein
VPVSRQALDEGRTRQRFRDDERIAAQRVEQLLERPRVARAARHPIELGLKLIPRDGTMPPRRKRV